MFSCFNPEAKNRGKITDAKLLIPSYFTPTSGDWGLINDIPHMKTSTRYIILNPNSGPGASKSQEFVELRNKMKDFKVLGYVHSSYSKRSIEQVLTDIDKWMEWYKPDGIFLDEVLDTDRPAIFDYYSEISEVIRSVPNTQVVFNFGVPAPEMYMKICDIMVNFEGSFGNYTGHQKPTWEVNYEKSRFCHLIHNVPDPEKLKKTIEMSKNFHIGLIYMTPLKNPNPWLKLSTHLKDKRNFA